MINLNELKQAVDPSIGEEFPLFDVGGSRKDGKVEVHFRHLEDKLVQFILDSQVVVGCVAWLTSVPVLEALAQCEAVSIIVQKEDWLRPDYGDESGWQARRRSLYAALPGGLKRNGGFLHNFSTSLDRRIDPVRCVGLISPAGSKTSPRSHHKFIVSCSVETQPNGRTGIEADAVWTGSYNFTKNASASLENVVILRERAFASAYFQEWEQICALSEPLDWTAEWVRPQWRFGT